MTTVKTFLSLIFFVLDATTNLAQAAMCYFCFLVTRVHLKQWQCDRQLDHIQRKYKAETNCICQCIALAIMFLLVMFSNNTKFDKSAEMSQ